MGNINYNDIEELKEIKHSLIKELIEYGKKDGKLNEIDTLAHAVKNLCKIVEDAEMELEGGFSGRYAQARGGGGGGQGGSSGYYAGRNYAGYYAGDMDYAQHGMMMQPDYYYAMAQGGGQGGSSGARGRGPGAARDSMGRYSSHGNLAGEIYSLMGQAKNEMERQELQNLAEKLQRME